MITAKRGRFVQPPLPDEAVEIGTSIELFSGGGGLALSMHDAGFRHLVAVELDKRACATLRLNRAIPFDECAPEPRTLHDMWPLIEGDIHKVDFSKWEGRVDVVAGGVPCQPWSLGGAHRGFDDHRNLWPELFRCVNETRPLAVVAENVKGLLRPSFKPYYDYVIDELKAPFERPREGEDWRDHKKRLEKVLKSKKSPDLTERYDVKYKLVNAADYGVPQIRWRVFVVAFRKDLGLADWEIPDGDYSELALMHAQDDGEYWEEHEIAPRDGVAPDVLAEPDGKMRWRTLRDAISGLPEPIGVKAENPPWSHHCFWPGAREYPGHTPNDLDAPAKTVKAGVHGVPGGETVMRRDDDTIRYMTVREAARVMTFPDDWRLSGPRGEQMRQLGNAVPVALGRAIADSVAGALAQGLSRGRAQ